MTWTKLSDDFSDDCWQLTDAAFRLHTEALIWSNRKLLDCDIPKDDLRRFAKHPEAFDELLAIGWWEDRGDHYQIHHHGLYQRSRDQVLALQKRNQTNGARGGRPTKPTREITQTETQMGSQMETQRDRTGQDRAGQEKVVTDQIEQIDENGVVTYVSDSDPGSDPVSDFFREAEDLKSSPRCQHPGGCVAVLSTDLQQSSGLCAFHQKAASHV